MQGLRQPVFCLLVEDNPVVGLDLADALDPSEYYVAGGRLYARHFRASVSSETVILALRYFRRQIGTPLLVVGDRLNAHRSQVTTAFIAAHPQDYAVAYLPAYAPELNPEEQCNACVKRAMESALPASVADLHRLADM